MKIAIISNSGNVGKTTIAREVLALNLHDPVMIEIETRNAGNTNFKEYFTNYKKFIAEQVVEFYELLALSQNAVIDVGSSNMLEFFKKIEEYGINNIFDKIIIPVTPDNKQQIDTLTTIAMLLQLGTDATTIYVVANRVKSLITFEDDFEVMLNASADMGFIFGKDYVIKETSIFKDLEKSNKILKAVLEDDTNYIELAKNATSEDEKKKYIKLDLIQRAGKNLYKDLQKLYYNIVGNSND